MRDIFVTIVVFGLLPKIITRPDIGILLWCWLSYMNPHKLSWSFAHDFPFAFIVALVILVALLIWKEPKKIPFNRVTVWQFLFIGWMFVTTWMSVSPQTAWVEWNKVWKIQLMTFVTMIIMTTRWRINAMILVIALSLAFYGVKGGIFTVLTGGSYAVYGPSGTFIYGNNEIGLALLMTIPLLRYLQLQTDRNVFRRGLGIAMALCLVSIVGTQSRGALVGLAVMTTMLVWKSPKKVVLILGLMVIIPAVLAFMPETWWSRMHTIKTYEQDASAMGRINAWTMAYNLAKDRIFGGGYECFQVEYMFELYAPIPDNMHDAHSIYFEVLGEHGFIGLALFLLLAWAAWKEASQIAKLTASVPHLKWLRDLMLMFQVSLLGYASSGAFLGLAYFDLYYNILAVIAVSRGIYDRELANSGDAEVVSVAAAQRDVTGFVRPVHK